MLLTIFILKGESDGQLKTKISKIFLCLFFFLYSIEIFLRLFFYLFPCFLTSGIDKLFFVKIILICVCLPMSLNFSKSKL